MNVLLVSECSKNALSESRRIIDQFAERCGERTWQTAITREGLDELRKALKRTARKNTAVACHWIHGNGQSELLWVVGDARHFNMQGVVPTNWTERDILRVDDENDWRSLENIRLLVALAALFHDWGKASQRFARKLKGETPQVDPIRHEWVSLRLLQALVEGYDSDQGWLTFLANLPDTIDDTILLQRLTKDLADHPNRPRAKSPFAGQAMPPLASLLGWLIVSHHRLPLDWEMKHLKTGRLEALPKGIDPAWDGARLTLDGLSTKEQETLQGEIENCWCFPDGLPWQSEVWRTRVRKHARRILKTRDFFGGEWLEHWDPYISHMSRLALMLADHHYSSLSNSVQRVFGDPGYKPIANTLWRGEPNQRLDEHLIGVELHSQRILRSLSGIETKLPRIARHRGFSRRTSDPSYSWQNKAYDLASSLREQSRVYGFFGVSMASTGKGKTLGNGRIMYALADPQRGARFTIALGLRTLTLQTGEVYRKRLSLGEDDLAVLVGDAQVRDLFALGQSEAQRNEDRPTRGPLSGLENNGSESMQDLLPEDFVHYDGSIEAGPLNDWLQKSRGMHKLVSAPILACTIDHLVPATESWKGGHQIAPMLRLMSADLILDEPDDFDLNDLPALARLVHWAGMLGGRVLLSSATLPPAMVEGLFAAYRKGREIFQRHRGEPGAALNICTAWFDEFDSVGVQVADEPAFMERHLAWTRARVERLAKQGEQRRLAEIVPMNIPASRDLHDIADPLAELVIDRVQTLHRRHHSVDAQTDKRVSFGLVRIANIDPLIELAGAIACKGPDEGTRLHMVVYHSQFPLLLRSRIERSLDSLLDRHQADLVFQNDELRAALDRWPEVDHIFLILATPVAEVGRDHDYDWAIVEPSSMRSIIQLAGRVRRHRPGTVREPNLLLLDCNIRAIRGEDLAFIRPGFESKVLPLKSHHLTDIMRPDELAHIDARARILEPAEPVPTERLVDLEHNRLRAVMAGGLGDHQKAVTPWWTTRAHLSALLQRHQPFREDRIGTEEFAMHFDSDEGQAQWVRIEQDGSATPQLLPAIRFEPTRNVSCLLNNDYGVELAALADAMDMDMESCAQRYGLVALPVNELGYEFNNVLGLRRRK